MIRDNYCTIDLQIHSTGGQLQHPVFYDVQRVVCLQLASLEMNSSQTYGATSTGLHNSLDVELGPRHWRKLQLAIAASEVRGSSLYCIIYYII